MQPPSGTVRASRLIPAFCCADHTAAPATLLPSICDCCIGSCRRVSPSNHAPAAQPPSSATRWHMTMPATIYNGQSLLFHPASCSNLNIGSAAPLPISFECRIAPCSWLHPQPHSVATLTFPVPLARSTFGCTPSVDTPAVQSPFSAGRHSWPSAWPAPLSPCSAACSAQRGGQHPQQQPQQQPAHSSTPAPNIICY